MDVGAGFSAASQGANSGQWQVGNEQTLVLRYGNGDVEQYDLSYTNNTLYLNGRRYFVVEMCATKVVTGVRGDNTSFNIFDKPAFQITSRDHRFTSWEANDTKF